MEIFINELSLQGQYFSDTEFAEAVKVFSAIFFLINERIKKPKMYKSAFFINYEAIHSQYFQASFQRIKDRQLKVAFKNIVFNKLNPCDWQLDRKHCSDDLFTVGEDVVVTDTSVAELAERRLQDIELCGVLVNFIHSRFANQTSVDVVKNEQTDIAIDCVDNLNAMQGWLETNTSTIYSSTCKLPPRDEQTILYDTMRFKRTTTIVQGRRVYREENSGYYWYVDNLHVGNAAHLEIFGSQGEHLGIATIEGKIDFSVKILGRKITVS